MQDARIASGHPFYFLLALSTPFFAEITKQSMIGAPSLAKHPTYILSLKSIFRLGGAEYGGVPRAIMGDHARRRKALASIQTGLFGLLLLPSGCTE
jgi:hypothetical protein